MHLGWLCCCFVPSFSLVISAISEDFHRFSAGLPRKCGEIAEDVVQYLALSEQTPASMGLQVDWDSEVGVETFFGGGWEEMPKISKN